MTSLIAGVTEGFDEHLVSLLRPSSWEAERIRGLQLDELRPIEALQLLAELQEELKRCV